MKIKSIRAKNFLSIGETPIEIDFTKYQNIINIKGENLDVGEGASNGAGKTTIVEIIVYALYGKLIKGLSHKEAINIKTKKGLEVEIRFDDYRIVRRRKPDELHLWESGEGIWNKETEITIGGGPATQEEIVRRIKLNYNSFINIACFGQHNTNAFLSCSAGDKRSIAENLLSLDKYVQYCERTKKRKGKAEQKIDNVSAVYDAALQDYSFQQKQNEQMLAQQEQWITKHQQEIETLSTKLEQIKKKLAATKDGDALLLYQRQQEELEKVNEDLEEVETSRQKTINNSRLAEDKAEKVKTSKYEVMAEQKGNMFQITAIQKELNDAEGEIRGLTDKSGTTCPVCYAEVSPANFNHIIEHHEEENKRRRHELKGLLDLDKDYKEKLQKIEKNLSLINSAREQVANTEMVLRNKIKDLSKRKQELSKVSRPNAETEALLLQQEISHIDTQLKTKSAEINPYKDMIEISKEELIKSQNKVGEYKRELNNLKSQIPYLDFWIRAFGDKGIRAFVIDEIIPILNSRINYWLHFLIGGKIQLFFNNELEERIERNPSDGDPFVYQAMSGGEHRRIDLAINQAFAYVMSLQTGACPSLVCLDEVATNMDRLGVMAIYNMIQELSRDRTCLITTHDPDLLEMLSGFETITIRKKDGFSRKID